MPGKSGNPKGRPEKTNSVTWWYKKLLAERKGVTAKEMAEMAIEKAKEGSLGHLQEVTDRTDGRLQDTPPPSYQDNRQINIIASDDLTKRELEKLMPKGITQEQDDGYQADHRDDDPQEDEIL